MIFGKEHPAPNPIFDHADMLRKYAGAVANELHHVELALSDITTAIEIRRRGGNVDAANHALYNIFGEDARANSPIDLCVEVMRIKQACTHLSRGLLPNNFERQALADAVLLPNDHADRPHPGLLGRAQHVLAQAKNYKPDPAYNTRSSFFDMQARTHILEGYKRVDGAQRMLSSSFSHDFQDPRANQRPARYRHSSTLAHLVTFADALHDLSQQGGCGNFVSTLRRILKGPPDSEEARDRVMRGESAVPSTSPAR